MVLSQNQANDGGSGRASSRQTPEVEENGACPGRGKPLGLVGEGAPERDGVREVSGPF